jgi:hypothetical protein
MPLLRERLFFVAPAAGAPELARTRSQALVDSLERTLAAACSYLVWLVIVIAE